MDNFNNSYLVNYFITHNQMKKNIQFIILALVIIGAITLWQNSVWQAKNKAPQVVNQEIVQENIATTTIKEEPAPVQTKINVNFIFAETDSQNISYSLAENNTKSLFTISQEIAKENNWDWQYQNYGELGTLVSKINNTQNGQDNKYWQYYIDDKQPQVSADKYIPKSGEKIEWRFAESKF